jgi:dipeptidyl aminopeptidase/acylaminoacyl peptidase
MRPARLACAALLLAAAPASAQTVAADHGGIVLSRPGAAPVQLTAGGTDRDPVLSPDGRRVAFVRGGGPDGRGPSELWTVDARGGGERRLLAERPSDEPPENLTAFASPAFAPDGRDVYVLATAWATSGAVHAVDLATGRVRYVCPGNSLEVVPRGEYAGHLVVTQHRYFVGGGSYDWYWLVTPEGGEVGPLGESAELFRESWMER